MTAETNPFDLTGRVALVTGGSRGLGLAMARALGRAGAAVIITARKADELAAAGEALSADGITVDPVRADLTDLEAAAPFTDQLLERHGVIDILVNNAGVSWGSPADSHPLEAWRKVIGTNLDGVFALTQAVAVKSMLPRGSGSVIMIGSVAGFGGAPAGSMEAAAYHASKAGVLNLTRALAAEWGPRGIRVNCIAPGWFPTKMSRGLLARHEEAMLARIPLGRFGDPDQDITGPVLFLASDAARYVTGAVLSVDGGQSALV